MVRKLPPISATELTKTMGDDSAGQKIREVSQGRKKDASSLKHSEIILVGTKGEQKRAPGPVGEPHLLTSTVTGPSPERHQSQEHSCAQPSCRVPRRAWRARSHLSLFSRNKWE